MEDRISDFFKKFDPTSLKNLDNLNITKILKQLEQLKLSGFLERLEDINKVTKLLKQMDDIKLSEIVKKVEEIKLSNILKQVEDNKITELFDHLPNPLKALKNGYETSSIKIENRTDSIPDQIKKFFELKNSGIISEEEFKQVKKKLLEDVLKN